MISIKINSISKEKLIHPVQMINSEYGTVFQQYFHSTPSNTYYMSCGNAEPSVVSVWYDDEDKEYKLSTDDAGSLSELTKETKVKKIDATIKIELTNF